MGHAHKALEHVTAVIQTYKNVENAKWRTFELLLRYQTRSKCSKNSTPVNGRP